MTYPKNCMKRLLTAGCLMLGSLLAGHAQDKPSVNIDAQTRVGYLYDRLGGETRDDQTGFKGEYLNLIVNGNLNRSFSYSWRQRMNKKISDSDFFDATDWIYLNYQADRHWSLAAGKQVVLIGGYEYDRAPIDVFMSSEYWNNIPCYQFGATLTYTTSKGNDKLTAQFCESPFHSKEQRDLFAYNLYWSGTHGPLSTLYSLNLLEYAPHKFISYIALGHRLCVGKAALELDLMNRASDHQTYLFRDCSVMADLSYFFLPQLKLYAKATYDVNRTHSVADLCVMPGTELTTLGGGIEYFPLKKPDIRLNACIAHTTGHNGNPNGTMLDDRLTVHVGLTVKLHLLSFTHP